MSWANRINEAPVEKHDDEINAEEDEHEESIEQQENSAPSEPATEELMEEEKPRPNLESASTQFTLLNSAEIEELKSRWNSLQIEFVDEPRKSVEQADALVAETLKRVEQAFTAQRTTLEGQWTNNEEVSTEDLRILLQSYRSFFNRFLGF